MKPLSQIFRPDPAAALAKAQAELTSTRAALAGLERQRGEALAETAEIASIRAIDRQAEEAAASIRLLEDRIVRLTKAAREAERQKLITARDEAVAKILEPALARIAQLGERLEAAVFTLSESYAALMDEQRKLDARWPRAVPRPAW
jgi:hypothetical protein